MKKIVLVLMMSLSLTMVASDSPCKREAGDKTTVKVKVVTGVNTTSIATSLITLGYYNPDPLSYTTYELDLELVERGLEWDTDYGIDMGGTFDVVGDKIRHHSSLWDDSSYNFGKLDDRSQIYRSLNKFKTIASAAKKVLKKSKKDVTFQKEMLACSMEIYNYMADLYNDYGNDDDQIGKFKKNSRNDFSF
jgi:hypothetical protein